ncbi:MAG TPA: zinc-dependent metalloprotease, partial [Kutzneria sp.]|nr:zinc-dependent metalloprotease [Kutzneria sp.]
MTDLPFGFNPSPNPDDRGEGSSGGGNTPPGGMPPGGVPFDMGQLGQMLSQLGQMLSQAQTSGAGPVNY